MKRMLAGLLLLLMLFPHFAMAGDSAEAPEGFETISSIFEIRASYNRRHEREIFMPVAQDDYGLWMESGLLTFRGGPMRQNPASGPLETAAGLREVWKVPVGAAMLEGSAAQGIAWPGQPAIVKWPLEIRHLMDDLYPNKTDTIALKEVIVAGRDGLVYFWDLLNGEPTRNPIDMGIPGGSVSVCTNFLPIIGVGQSPGSPPGEYRLFDLITGKELPMPDSLGNARGSALFDKKTGAMIAGGQNAILYTAEITAESDWYRLSQKLNLSFDVQGYQMQVAGQDEGSNDIATDVAMYRRLAYYINEMGVLQCVDVNTLSCMWMAHTGDSVVATPALDYDAQNAKLAVYTGNTILRQGEGGVCTIRRYNGITGKEEWAYPVPQLAYSAEHSIGCVASPVVGEGALAAYVYFTVTNGEQGSQVIALRKSNGSVVWSADLATETKSSPVAIYPETGCPLIVQAESDGKIHLLDALTGEIVSTFAVEGTIEASPAVYRSMLVIGATEQDTDYLYGIEIY